jgi:hypothetical protein
MTASLTEALQRTAASLGSQALLDYLVNGTCAIRTAITVTITVRSLKLDKRKQMEQKMALKV